MKLKFPRVPVPKPTKPFKDKRKPARAELKIQLKKEASR